MRLGLVVCGGFNNCCVPFAIADVGWLVVTLVAPSGVRTAVAIADGRTPAAASTAAVADQSVTEVAKAENGAAPAHAAPAEAPPAYPYTAPTVCSRLCSKTCQGRAS